MWKRATCIALTCALGSMVFHDPAVRARIVLALRRRHSPAFLPAWKAEFPTGWRGIQRAATIAHMMLLAGNKGVKL